MDYVVPDDERPQSRIAQECALLVAGKTLFIPGTRVTERYSLYGPLRKRGYQLVTRRGTRGAEVGLYLWAVKRLLDTSENPSSG